MTSSGGVTDGTYYGVMEFLERHVGVRWLLPRPNGEDVPVQATLRVPPIAIKDAPDFPCRSMTMRFGTISNRWLRHQRVTSSRQPIIRSQFNHAWDRSGMRERLQGHPEYLALVKDERTKVQDWRPEMQEMKFCTTNADLIDLYATALMEEMTKASRPADVAHRPIRRRWLVRVREMLGTG